MALINGIMHVIIDKRLAQHRSSLSSVRKDSRRSEVVKNYPPEKVAEITGVTAEDIVKIAEWYATAKATSIVYCMGITQHTTGMDNVKTLGNLAMLTGQIGREATGVNPLRGQNNVQGACDMGGLPNVYTGYQAVTVPEFRDKFEAAWGANFPKSGAHHSGNDSGADEGSVKAVYILGKIPWSAIPTNHVEKALRNAWSWWLSGYFPHPDRELATWCFPGASFAEKDGTFTNTERRVQRVRKAIEPVGELGPTGRSCRKSRAVLAIRCITIRQRKSWTRSPGSLPPMVA